MLVHQFNPQGIEHADWLLLSSIIRKTDAILIFDINYYSDYLVYWYTEW